MRAPRVLSAGQLNRSLLARQLLLGRSRLSLPRTLERVGGLQAQYAPSMYIGLWSRVAGFERDQLTRALERRAVVQATLMRSTIHLVSAADYWPMAVAVRDGRRRWWKVTHKTLSEPEVERAAGRLRSELSGGPLKRAEVQAVIGDCELGAAGAWLEMVRVPPSGTWERRRADLFGSAEEWLGGPAVSRAAALELIVRRYLRAFGPATLADLAGWAGIPVPDLEPAVDRVPLRRFRSERDDELIDLPRMPILDAHAPAPPRFLPTWDANLLVHTRRTGILPEDYRPLIFNSKNPQSIPTFLIDGRVVGTWRFDNGADRVRIEPFEPIPRGDRRELEREAQALAAFHR